MEEQVFIVKELLPIDRPNRNNRIYSRSCAEKIVKDFNDKKNVVFGEIESPGSNLDGLAIKLDRISHEIEEVFIEGDFLKAKIRVLGTPMGKIANQLHTSGVSLGFAMRGTGVVHPSGNINEYTMLTVDLTWHPSTLTEKSFVDQIEEIMDSMVKDGLI